MPIEFADNFVVSASTTQLVGQVRTQLAIHRARKGEPSLVIAGERPGAPSALVLALTLLHECRCIVGAKKLRLEKRPEFASHAFTAADPGQGLFARRLLSDEPLWYGQTADAPLANLRTTGLYARHLGFEIGGFDTLAGLADALADAQLMVVVTASRNMPLLHQALSPHFNTLSIATMETPVKDDTEVVRRASLLLSMPEILKISPSTALEAAPLDAVRFINHMLR